MKLQHVAVMFVLIFMPIILVTSYFINLQVKTIKLESSYNEKLINATYDAMTSFELNTANENLSTVSDSLRGIIDASNNIFFNTLCTNMGISNASKSYIQPYIPAILYTLYDGYYIYSPTNIPEICIDKFGRTIRTNDYGVTGGDTEVSGIGIYYFDKDSIIYSNYNSTEPAPEITSDPNENVQTAPKVNYGSLANKEEYGQILYKNNDGSYSTQLHTFSGNYNKSTYYKRDYILKSYIPYSARYDNGSNINVTINYTLDNFMTIEGIVKDIYYTKSGYFIDDSLVNSIKVDGTEISWTTYSDDVLKEYINNPEIHKVEVELNDGVTISNKDGAVGISGASGGGTEIKYWDDAQSAVEYYVTSYIFSKWVHEELSGLTASNLKISDYSVADIQKNITAATDLDKINKSQSKLLQSMLYDFKTDSTKPFDASNNNPEDIDKSAFYSHKRNIIKNSITYNLILSMLVYTEESRTTEFNMPVFSEKEWDRILNNVSIITFMEGMKCGLKYYNNYAIVTSTNNEISVTDNEIYYVPRADTKNATGNWILNVIDNKEYIKNGGVVQTAHRIDCPDLILNYNGAISFKSKEIKYDKILKKTGEGTTSYEYEYDHMAYTDYDCIVDSNYKVKTVLKKLDGTNYQEDGNTDVLDYLLKNSTATGGNIDTALKDQLKYKLRAYRIAIAKERNNLYKTTAFFENYGWQVIYKGGVGSGGVEKSAGSNIVNISLAGLGINDLSKIKKIEVIIEDAKIKDASGNPVLGIYTDSITASFGSQIYSESQIISTTSSSRRTLEYIQDFSTGTADTLTLTTTNSNTQFIVEAVKVYYK